VSNEEPTMMAEHLITLLKRARKLRPELTEGEIAHASDMSQPTLSRAKRACAPETFSKVAEGVHVLTGVRYELRVVRVGS
jgi:hypothetical protein